MVTLTPETIGNSFVIVGITYVITIVFSLYSLYLSWKQSKVRENTKETNDILHEILWEIKKKGGQI